MPYHLPGISPVLNRQTVILIWSYSKSIDRAIGITSYPQVITIATKLKSFVAAYRPCTGMYCTEQ